MIWMLASTAFFGSLRALTSIKNTIIEIDSQIISLKKVMDADTNFESMLRSATESAKEFGRTIDGALQSYERYAKMGFNQFQVEDLARNAMLLSTVGDIEDAKSAEYLTAALLQFNMALDQGIKVVDSWNHVSNQFPVTVEDLALGFTRAASAANVANVSFDELSGMITSIQASTRRGGQQIGNSLRTIFTNLNSSKAQKALEELDIQVKNTDGSLRSATEVFGELSGKWETLTNAEQSYTAESIANKFHINNFMAMMTNWGMVVDSTTQSMNSHGSATNELATFQEGLAFKINNLKASWQELALTMGSEGGFKAVIEGIISSLTFMSDGFTKLTDATNGWNVKLPVLIALGYGAVKMFHALRLAATGAKLSLGWIGVGLIGVELLASAFMKTTQASDINTEAVMKNAQQYKDSSDRIKELIERHDKLKTEVEQGADKQDELRLVLEQIRKISPQLIELTGEYGDVLSLNKDKADQYTKSLEKLTEEQLKHAKTLAEIELARASADLDGIRKELNKIEDDVKNSFDKIKEFQLEFNVEGILDAEEEISKRLDILAEKWTNTTNQIEITNIAEEMGVLRNRLQDYLKLMNDDTLSDYTDKHNELTEALSKKEGIEERIEIIDQWIAGTYDASGALDKLKYTLEEEAEVLDENEKLVNELSQAQKKLTDQFNSAISSIETLNGFLNELNEGHQLSAKSIATIMEKYPDLLGYMNDEVALIEQIKIKLQEEEQIAKQVVYNKIKDNEHFFREVLKGNNHLIKELSDFYGVDLSNFKSLAEAKGAIEIALMSKLSKEWSKYYNASTQSLTQQGRDLEQGIKDGRYAGGEAYALRGAIESARAQARSVESLFKDISFESFNVDFKGIGLKSPSDSKSSKSSPKSTKDDPAQKDKLDAYIRQINAQHQLVALENDQLKSQIEQAKNQSDYNKQLELTNSLISGQQSQVVALRKANEQIHQKANAIRGESKFNTSNWFDNNNQETQEYINLYNSLSKTEQEIAQNTFNRLQKLKGAFGENSNEISNLIKFIDELTISLPKLSFDANMQSMSRFSSLMEGVDRSIKKSQLTREQYEEGSTDWVNSIQGEIKHLEYKQHLYEREATEIKKLLQNTNLSTEEYNYWTKALSDNTLAQLENMNAIRNNSKTIEQQMKQFANQIVDTYKDAYRKQLRIVQEGIKDQLDELEKAHKRKIDMLDEEMKKFEDVVNAQIRAIDDEESEDDFNKRLTELQDEELKLRQEINVKSLDDSIENKVNLVKLEEDLQKKIQEIEVLKKKRTIDLRKQNLRDELEAKRTEIQYEKDAAQQKHDIERKRLDDERLMWERHYENLIEDEERWNIERENIMNGHVTQLISEFERMKNEIEPHMESMGESITKNLLNKISEAQALMGGLSNANLSSPSSSPSSSTQSNTLSTWGHDYKVDASGNVYKNGQYVPAENFKHIPEEVLEMARKAKLNKYHSGGIVGDKAPSKITELANKMFNANPNEQVIKSLLGELQIPPQNMSKYFIPNTQRLINSAMGKVGSGSSITIEKLLQIDKIENGTNLDIERLVDQVNDKFVQKLRTYGLVR